MALVLKLIYTQMSDILFIEPDSRYDNSFLMGSPLKIIAIIAFYLYFVKSYGRRLMENRKPFKIDGWMAAYNITQVVLNGYIAYDSTKLLVDHWKNPYDLRCVQLDFSGGYLSNYEAYLTYYYYLLKAFDLFDTIFFVLRKKFNQITFLHVYHHAVMFVCAYIFARYLPGGHVGMLGIVNSYVHTAMYFYYLLSIYSINVKNSLWFKKCITKLQLLQFLFLTLYFLVPLVFVNCNYPKFWLVICFSQNIFMLVLFSDFYIKTYVRKLKNN